MLSEFYDGRLSRIIILHLIFQVFHEISALKIDRALESVNHFGMKAFRKFGTGSNQRIESYPHKNLKNN